MLCVSFRRQIWLSSRCSCQWFHRYMYTIKTTSARIYRFPTRIRYQSPTWYLFSACPDVFFACTDIPKESLQERLRPVQHRRSFG